MRTDLKSVARPLLSLVQNRAAKTAAARPCGAYEYEVDLPKAAEATGKKTRGAEHGWNLGILNGHGNSFRC